MVIKVAPFTGAWIETRSSSSVVASIVVAPFTGAWIETKGISYVFKGILSPPSRGRGLKLMPNCVTICESCRPLHGGVD